MKEVQKHLLKEHLEQSRRRSMLHVTSEIVAKKY